MPNERLKGLGGQFRWPTVARRTSPAVIVAVMMAGCAMQAGESPPVAARTEALRDLDSIEREFLRLLNEHRAANGAGPVRPERALNEGARDYSRLMGEEDHFDHTGPDGSSFSERMCEAGYDPACGPSTAVGENIAAGQSTAMEVFESWRGSPGHNENMLDPRFKVVGIGRAEVSGSEWGVYWTNTFGGQETAETVPLDAGAAPSDGGPDDAEDAGSMGGADAGPAGRDAGPGSGGDAGMMTTAGSRDSGCAAGGAPPAGAGLAIMLAGLALAVGRRRSR